MVVLSAYKQIRAQSTNVLADIDEDNFDKAFTFFRPREYSYLLLPFRRTARKCRRHR